MMIFLLISTPWKFPSCKQTFDITFQPMGPPLLIATLLFCPCKPKCMNILHWKAFLFVPHIQLIASCNWRILANCICSCCPVASFLGLAYVHIWQRGHKYIAESACNKMGLQLYVSFPWQTTVYFKMCNCILEFHKQYWLSSPVFHIWNGFKPGKFC